MAAYVTFQNKGFVRQLAALADQKLPENVVITSSAKGWMKEETAHHWFNNVLERFITAGQDERFLLLVDRYRVHRTEDFGERVTMLGGILDFIPAGCTSLVQPLDLTVMKSFKNHLRNAWKNWKKDNTDDDGRCDRITLRQVVTIVGDAWAAVPAQVVENGFDVAFLGDARLIDAGSLEELDQEQEEGLEFAEIDRGDIEMD